MKKPNRTLRRGLYDLAVLALVLAAAILANLVADKLPKSLTQQDMNRVGILSLSPQTKAFLQPLHQEATIYWIVEEGQEDTLLSQLLDRFTEQTSQLQVEKIDPIQQPRFASQYTNKQVSQNSLIVVSGEKHQYVDASELYEYKLAEEAVQSAIFYGEQKLGTAIHRVTSQEQVTLCVLSGHGETRLPEGILSALTAQNYTVLELDLAAAGAVPEGCDALLVNGVTTDLPTAQMQMVADFLKSGGGLCLFSTYLDETTPNWTSMLSQFGMEPVPGILVEANADHHMSGYPYWLLPKIQSHPVTEGLALSGLRVLTPLTQGMALAGSMPEGVTAEALLQTSAAAYSKAAGFAMQTTDKESGDLEGPFLLGAAASRQMDGGKEGRIVWIPSAYVLDDTIDEAVSGGNSTLLTGSIQWLTQSDGPALAAGKQLGGGSLLLTQTQSSLLSILVMVIIPLSILACGVILVRRRARR